MWNKVLSILILFCTIAALWISIKWSLNDSDSHEAKIAAIQGVGGLLALLLTAAWWKKKSKPKVTDPISVSYMRLFGAVEVPLLMRLIGHEGPFPKFGEIPSYRETPDGIISEEMNTFWRKKWTYRKAMPVINDLWSTYCGSRWSGVNLYFNSLRATKEDLLTFSSCIEVDAAFCLALEVAEHHKFTYDQAWYPDRGTGTKPSDIAFLFVILQNKTGATLEDLELEWKVYKNPLLLRSYEPKHLFTPLSDWPNPEHAALTDEVFDLTTQKRECKKIALLRENDSLIIALSAYKADAKGFPDFYLTDVTVPVKVSAMLKGVRASQNIRKPFLDKSAKILVPNGWFHQ